MSNIVRTSARPGIGTRAPVMHAFATADAGFLLAVLWFDLMFDVQTRKAITGPLQPELLASISGPITGASPPRLIR
jgi:hypothetical protein